jgi:pimeloyl-ACP methyl ester carboxylesterase
MTHRICEFQHHPIHYRVIGNGAAVMLIHGFAEDNSIWNDIVASLSENYQFILPNIPGSGGSPAMTKQHSIDDYAAAMLAILQERQLADVVVIGHSMGGYIALAMAEKKPSSIKALGLFHSSAYADDALKIATRLKAISFLQENGSQAFLKTSLPGLFADPLQHKKSIDNLLQKAEKCSSDTLIQYYEAMIKRPDRTDLLVTAKFPVLFVMGFEDKAVPFSHSLQQSHLPSIGHISILRGSAHMGMIEEPAKSLLVLTDFLRAIYV